MSFIQNLFTSRDNNANAETFVGQQDRIWWNPVTNAFYYSDGSTLGGVLITGGSSGNGTVGGTNTQVQFNNAGNFGGDPNFVFNSATSTLTITNIVANTITGGAGGANTQVLFNDSGNIRGNAQFTFDKVTNTLTQTGSAYLGNIYPVANNTSNIGGPTARFYDLWLGSGNINLIDDTLNTNQEINAVDGNLVISGGNGLKFGQFAMYGNIISTINPAANINLGLTGSTGYVNVQRPLAVNTTGSSLPQFVVEPDGRTKVFAPSPIAITDSAFQIVGTPSGNTQPRNFTGTMMQVTGQPNTSTRITMDAFGTEGAQNAYGIVASRVARGTVDSPQPTQANDILFRLSSQAWTGANAYATGIARLSFGAAQNFSNASATGTYANIQLTPIGSSVIKTVTGFSGNGVNFPNALSGGTGNLGITFQDGTFQNTAYSPTTTVSSLTAGAGISLSSNTGNITIASTGVLGVNGTTNQINVANVGNVLTLSLPQNFNTTANVQLYSLTVQDLIVLGNISNVIPSVVGGNIIYVANTATNFLGINNSGLVTGNIGNSVWAGILYDTTSNTWTMDIGNSVGITSANVYTDDIIANNRMHVGQAASQGYDFPNALIQGDINIDGYGQFVLRNHSQTANSSSDIVAVANNGDDGSYYIDMGINSNVYANADYAVTGFNDGYLYVNGGNLVIGTQTNAKVIKFFTDSTDNVSNVRMTVNSVGLSVVGNVTANNMISTNATIGGTVSAIGNVTGGNVLVPAGIVSASGNITGLNVNTGIVSATGNITGANIGTAGRITATGNIVGGNLVTAGFANVGNITTANLTAGNITTGIISTTGNITGPNITATILTVSAILSVSGNITGGNLLTSGLISTTGNIAAGFFLGDGGLLSNISAAQASKIANGTSQVNIPTASGNANITIGATANVAVFATTGQYVTGLLSASGNVIGGNLVGQNLTAGRVAIVGSGKEVSDDADFTYNSSTNVLSLAGNINAANFIGNIISANNISNIGNVFVQGNIQYNLATDDGGNVTQLTNKATAVTCNGRTGRITTSSAAIAGGGSVTFTVNNTYVQQYDLIILNVKDPVRANTYHAQVNGVGTNSFNIMIRNVDNNSHSDAIVLSFAVIQVR